MDVFGSSSSSKLNKLISDGNKVFEYNFKKHGKSIDENHENIENLRVKTESFDNRLREIDDKNNISLSLLNDSVIKLQSRLYLSEKEILKINSRVNSLEVHITDST